jgi:glutamate/tyrosine decarboxylase-like PLP-dependent enzyme
MISDVDDQFLTEAFAALKNYLVDSPARPVVRQALTEALPALGPTGISHAELQAELTHIMDNSVRTAHPLFLNNLLAGFDPVSWIGEVASSLLNPTMATFEVAPLLTVIEKRMATELLRLFGIDRGEGIMTTGGSNANLLAVLCARSDSDPGLRRTGLPHNRFRIYVSEEAHYSFDKAANITGIGTENVVQVPCNGWGEMISEELERLIIADVQNGYAPVMVGATAGTTVFGAFDPIEEIAAICEAHEIWFHIDAAWGGGAVFSETGRALLKGAHRADSITIDAHKTLGTPLIASYFLTRHPAILKSATRGGGSDYLFHEDDPQWDSGTHSLQCGRRADALKLWLMWRYYGTDGLGAHMDKLLELARFSQSEVERQPKLKLLSSQYLNVCFQVRPADPDEDIDTFTLSVRQQIVSEGKALVNYASRKDGAIFFRLVLPNHQTKPEHITELIDHIVDTAEHLERQATADQTSTNSASFSEYDVRVDTFPAA